MGGSDSKGDGLASQPRHYRVPGQPLLNWHQVGGVSRSPDGLFAQQEREPIRGRPAKRGKRTYGVWLGQRVEEQGTWASRTQKHSEAGYGRPVDQYANYWAPLMRKRHTMPHSAQPQHTNYWAPRTQKRHQQEHRPQRLAESSNLMQHAKGRTGDRPGPRKGATTRRNVTQGGGKKFARIFFCTPLLQGDPPKKKTSTPRRIFFSQGGFACNLQFAALCTIRRICFIWQRVKIWVFTPCVHTQNTQIFQENSIMDENHFGLNINTILVQTCVRDGLYPSG